MKEQLKDYELEGLAKNVNTIGGLIQFLNEHPEYEGSIPEQIRSTYIKQDVGLIESRLNLEPVSEEDRSNLYDWYIQRLEARIQKAPEVLKEQLTQEQQVWKYMKNIETIAQKAKAPEPYKQSKDLYQDLYDTIERQWIPEINTYYEHINEKNRSVGFLCELLIKILEKDHLRLIELSPSFQTEVQPT